MTRIDRLVAIGESAGLSPAGAAKLAREAVAAGEDMRGVVLRRIVGRVDWRSPHGEYILGVLHEICPARPGEPAWGIK